MQLGPAQRGADEVEQRRPLVDRAQARRLAKRIANRLERKRRRAAGEETAPAPSPAPAQPMRPKAAKAPVRARPAADDADDKMLEGYEAGPKKRKRKKRGPDVVEEYGSA